MSLVAVLFGDDYVDNFHYSTGETPLTSGVPHVAGIIVLYFVGVYGLRAVYKPPQERSAWLQRVVIAHSSLLCFCSLLLLLDLVFALPRRFAQQATWTERFCGDTVHGTPLPGELQFMYYVNYLLKWYELLDTVLLVLKNKPLIFLHVYHHPATLFLAWAEMHYHVDIQYVPIVLNLAVHVVMYCYYALTALGHRPGWKRFLTIFQIVQFVIDVLACGTAFALTTLTHFTDLPVNVPCTGGSVAGAIGTGILLSYLVLFLAFYRKTYQGTGKSTASVSPALTDVPKKTN